MKSISCETIPIKLHPNYFLFRSKEKYVFHAPNHSSCLWDIIQVHFNYFVMISLCKYLHRLTLCIYLLARNRKNDIKTLFQLLECIIYTEIFRYSYFISSFFLLYTFPCMNHMRIFSWYGMLTSNISSLNE